MASEIFCMDCKCWVKVPKDDTARGTRRRHRKVCAGDPFAGHEDLLALDAELEYWFGDTH